jgi:hypothetical protein
MTKQEEIAQFLDTHCDLPRVTNSFIPPGYPRHMGLWHRVPLAARPSVEELAQQLLAKPEFVALRLGGFLGTPEWRVIAEGVELVSPPFYAADAKLLVDGLTYAAQLQAQGNRRAGLVAIGTVGVFGALLFGLGRGGAQAA